MINITPEMVAQAKKDYRTRNIIIQELIPYTKSLASKFEKRLQEDLEQEGVFGIINAIEQFDVSKNAKFTTYAYYKIKDLMSRYLYKENRSLTVDAPENAAPEPVDSAPVYNNSYEDAYKHVEVNIDLENALSKVKGDARIIFEAHHLNDVCLNDIKQKMTPTKSLEFVRQSNIRTMQKIRNAMMVTNQDIVIKYTPTNCQLIGKLSNDVIDVLWHTLSFNPQNYEFTDKFQMGHWDGVKRLFSKQNYKFRTGLLYKVIGILNLYGSNFTIDSQGFEIPFITEKPKNIPLLPMLRDYQKEAVITAVTQKRGGISSPPRTGKTIMAAGIINALKGKLILFLCFKIEIAIQTKQKFENILGQKIGYICDGIVDIQQINVASVQSVLAAYNEKWDFTVFKEDEKPTKRKQDIRDLLTEAEVIICDEYHHYMCKSAEFIFNKARAINYLFGLSATPWRAYEPESILLENNIGPVIFSKSYDEMIQKGYLLPAHIYIYKVPASTENNKLKSYPTIYKEYITDNDFRNNFIARIANKLASENKSCVITVTQKTHARVLQQLIPNSVILWGEHTSEERQKVLKQLEQKEILIVISTLLDEGVDIVTLNAVIIAAGGKSSINAYQRMRCLTPHSSKKFGFVFDFWDTAKFLNKHALERFTWYEQIQGFRKIYRTLDKDGNIKF